MLQSSSAVGEENLTRGAHWRLFAPRRAADNGPGAEEYFEREAKLKRGVFRGNPGSSSGKNGKGQVERLKVRAGATNQCVATRTSADPGENVDSVEVVSPGNWRGNPRAA
jgi:hypothetical protein